MKGIVSADWFCMLAWSVYGPLPAGRGEGAFQPIAAPSNKPPCPPAALSGRRAKRSAWLGLINLRQRYLEWSLAGCPALQ